MVHISSFVSAFSCVGFSGSRVSGSAAASSCACFLPLVSNYKGSVVVGCAKGVDFTVRSQFASACVFKVKQFATSGRISRASFALRSAAMVKHIVANKGLLVVFPLGACPSGVRPSLTFGGYGSGTWGSVALALGLGGSVLLVAPSGAPVSYFGCLASYFTLVGVAPCGGALYLANGVNTPVFSAYGQLSLF